METKNPLMSKTLWANLVLAVGALVGARVPAVADVVSADNVTLAFSFVNMLLRAVTKDKLSFS